MVVGRVQPEHLLKYVRRLVKALKTPETQSIAVHAAQKRTVVDKAPRQHAGKVVTQGQLADAQTDFVMPDGILRPVIKNKIAQMRVGIEAAQVRLAQLHQDLFRLCPLAGIFEIVGPGDGVIERIVGVFTGQHLLHLEHGAGAVSDDRLGPFLDGFVFPHGCDNVVRQYELWSQNFDHPYMHFVNVPHTLSAPSLRFLREELELFRLSLERFTGHPVGEEALREAISLGADSAVLLSDREFAGADTWATAYTLGRAVARLGQYDLVICGRQTFDGDTGQVGPELAEMLGIPFVAYVSKTEEIAGGSIRVRRMVEGGYEVIEMPLPAVVTVVKEINVPRLPSLRGLSRARSAVIPVWAAGELGVDVDRVGLAGSATRVVKVFFPRRVHSGEILQGDVESQVDSLVNRLREANLI